MKNENFVYEVESDLLNGEYIYFVSDDADISKLDKGKLYIGSTNYGLWLNPASKAKT